MTAMGDPALECFLAQLGPELLVGDVLIMRGSLGFELRHAADRTISAEELKLTDLSRLRALAQTTADGAFRPLKSAPNLRKGWRALVTSPEDLGLALNHLYPGAVADWFAVRQNPPPITGYRAFTSRQTGMYRKTQLLNEDQASKVVKACCHSRFCLKRRLWDVGGLGSDTVEAKSVIPCLEPCALLLEFARTVASIEQAEQINGPLPTTDASPLSGAPIREADFGAPENPRRLQWLLEKSEPSICSRSNPS